MFKVETKGFEELADLLRNAGKELPKAMAMTLTWMGQAAKQKMEAKIPQIFDRPVPWTQKSTYLKAADVTATRLQAEVYIKDKSINSLAHHIEGGKRRPKGYEKRLRSAGVLANGNWFTVPGKGMKLDAYGNIPRGQLNKILSAMGAQFDPLANSAMRKTRRSKNPTMRNKDQSNYFLVRSRQGANYTRRGKQLHPGIWYSGDGYVKPMLMFVKSTSYRRRYPFFELVEDAAYDAMPAAAARALARLGL